MKDVSARYPSPHGTMAPSTSDSVVVRQPGFPRTSQITPRGARPGARAQRQCPPHIGILMPSQTSLERPSEAQGIWKPGKAEQNLNTWARLPLSYLLGWVTFKRSGTVHTKATDCVRKAPSKQLT